jgi:hypothetical protein
MSLPSTHSPDRESPGEERTEQQRPPAGRVCAQAMASQPETDEELGTPQIGVLPLWANRGSLRLESSSSCEEPTEVCTEFIGSSPRRKKRRGGAPRTEAIDKGTAAARSWLPSRFRRARLNSPWGPSFWRGSVRDSFAFCLILCWLHRCCWHGLRLATSRHEHCTRKPLY